MGNIYCCLFHPQPPKGGSCSELQPDWLVAEVPFRACLPNRQGFSGKSKMEYDFLNFPT
jgi:hypothetical protein